MIYKGKEVNARWKEGWKWKEEEGRGGKEGAKSVLPRILDILSLVPLTKASKELMDEDHG